MKIGILTFHNGINYGGFFQVYALQNFLEEHGLECVVINYKDMGFTFREYMVFLNPMLSVRSIAKNIVKIIKFKKAQKKLNLSRRVFNKDKLKRFCFDKIIIGSDEVWNFKTKLIGYNPVYFSESLNAKSVISYAASFGTIEDNENIPEELVKLLNRLDRISVRDENSFNIMRSINDKPAQIVLDPAYLADLRKEAVLPKDEDFILVYGFFSEKMISKILEYAKFLKKKTISVGYDHRWCDVSLGSLSPFEWLGYFIKSDRVITTMYHGMIFSLLNSKEFCMFSTVYRKNKVGNFLDNLKLSGRMIDEDGSLHDLFADKIDYSDVNSNIDILRGRSKDFLLAALKS
jgi:hypothetical protein